MRSQLALVARADSCMRFRGPLLLVRERSCICFRADIATANTWAVRSYRGELRRKLRRTVRSLESPPGLPWQPPSPGPTTCSSPLGCGCAFSAGPTGRSRTTHTASRTSASARSRAPAAGGSRGRSHYGSDSSLWGLQVDDRVRQQVWIRAGEGLDAEPAVLGSVVDAGAPRRATRGVKLHRPRFRVGPTLRGDGVPW
jgi:hypothetical protein